MEIGTVNRIDINREMRSSYLDYAMSVIVARALPDARDGLKPVHRRILYAMNDIGVRANSPHRKSARIVGDVLGKYHPHGDASIYNAMVRMAQEFAMRYPLVDGQGNFGSIDGDGAAAMRYTEARLAPITSEILQDIEKNTVDFSPNFDDSLQEPDVLPSRLPNLLLNGSSGIAVGMSTDIPPHNLTELSQAIVYLIDRYDEHDDVTVEDLMTYVKGPDFPTGALIVGTEGIRNAYATGKGRVIMRAVAEIEEIPGRSERQRIRITEIPYQVNKATLIERIAELVNKGVIDSISDLRDESDREGLSIVVELKRSAQPKKVLNQLYKHTALQSTFSIQMLALVDRYPRLLSLKRALQIFIEHRVEVISRRTEFDLDKARKRQHILEGLLKAIDELDAVIDTIRRSPDADRARVRLVDRFGLSEAQASAILDMQLRRLAALEQQKLENEYQEVSEHIEYLESLLADKYKILAIIREETVAIEEKYGDERRSRVVAGSGDLNDEDLVEDIDVLIAITQRGYVKRTPTSAYRVQARGGKGLIGMNTRDEDELDQLLAAKNLDRLLFFTNKGKAYSVKAYEVPEADRTAKGTSLMNVLLLEPDEKVTTVLPVRNFENAEYLLMTTRKGRIKRVAVKSFEYVRSTGLRAISLDEGDELAWVKMTTGDQDVVLVSQEGKAIRFSEDAVRPMGRTAAGVNGIRLIGNDQLAGCAVVDANDIVIEDDDASELADTIENVSEVIEEEVSDSGGQELLLITEFGYGKRTPVAHFRQQGRYGQGVRAMKLDAERTGRIVSARTVAPDDEATVITANGIILRTIVGHISRQGRYSQGVRVMEMKDGTDYVASVAIIRERSSEDVSSDETSDEDDLASTPNVDTTSTEATAPAVT